MDSNNFFRINDYSGIKISDAQNNDDFYKIDNQYFLNTNRVVWESGDYQYRLNQSYLGYLYTPTVNDLIEKSYLNLKVLFKNGLNWTDLFGILVVVKDLNSSDVLLSQLIKLSDVEITNENVLIDGSFWNNEVNLKFPKVSNVVVQIVEVSQSDIVQEDTNIGYIYNYPQKFETIIDSKPIPDFILTKIFLNDNNYLNIQCYTTENKTLEQSILDYLGLHSANIEINHIIQYGIEDNFKSIKVSNEINKYSPIDIGLNFMEFYSETEIIPVSIKVFSQIYVNNTFIERIAVINTTLNPIDPLVANQITHPTTNFPVTVVKENIITNNVVEVVENTKIIPIIQPIFAELITDDIIFENKNIVFTNMSEQTIMFLNDDKKQAISARISSDNKYYFDLTDLIPITADTTYELFNAISQKIIGKGKMLVK